MEEINEDLDDDGDDLFAPPKQPVVSVSDIEKTSSGLYPRYSSATFIMNKAKLKGKKPKIESVATA